MVVLLVLAAVVMLEVPFVELLLLEIVLVVQVFVLLSLSQLDFELLW